MAVFTRRPRFELRKEHPQQETSVNENIRAANVGFNASNIMFRSGIYINIRGTSWRPSREMGKVSPV